MTDLDRLLRCRILTDGGHCHDCRRDTVVTVEQLLVNDRGRPCYRRVEVCTAPDHQDQGAA